MNQIKTISDLMQAIQDDTEAVKAGTIEESKARIVMQGRRLQVKVAEIVVQAERVSRQKGVGAGIKLALTAGEEPVTPAT